jgi:hypothetical protein
MWRGFADATTGHNPVFFSDFISVIFNTICDQRTCAQCFSCTIDTEQQLFGAEDERPEPVLDQSVTPAFTSCSSSVCEWHAKAAWQCGWHGEFPCATDLGAICSYQL